MRRILSILILFGSLTISAKNADSLEEIRNIEYFKKIMQGHRFVSTRSKYKVPADILNKVEVASTEEIAHKKEYWESGCVRTGKHPSSRLNWAAESKQGVWVICLSSGSFWGESRYCYIVDHGRVTYVRYFADNFREFKKWCLKGQPREKF
jgi:hypothetical protein